MEALHGVLRSRVATVDEIVRAAEVCRARTVMRPLPGGASAMTLENTGNVGASVRARLLNRSRETGENFQSLLQRYTAERFPLPPRGIATP